MIGRTLLWVALLDQAFVIFNNIPPRLTLRELEMGLACSEACFQAESAVECFNYLKQWINHVGTPRPQSLCSFIQLVCVGEMDSTALDRASHEGFMNLWCVVSGKLSHSKSPIRVSPASDYCSTRTHHHNPPSISHHDIPLLNLPPSPRPIPTLCDSHRPE